MRTWSEQATSPCVCTRRILCPVYQSTVTTNDNDSGDNGGGIKVHVEVMAVSMIKCEGAGNRK